MDNLAQENIKYTLSTQAVERVIPSAETIRLCEKLSSGLISADSAVDIIKKKYGLIRSKSYE